MRYSDRAPLTQDEREGSIEQRERRWFYTQYRQAQGKSAAAYGVGRTEDNRWGVECVLHDGRRMRIGVWSQWEEALRVQDYCVQRDIATKLALIELYENANYEPLRKLTSDALTFGQLPRRRLRVTMELEVEMRGTDDEIRSYLNFHVRTASRVSAARVTKLEGPRLEEPNQGVR